MNFDFDNSTQTNTALTTTGTSYTYVNSNDLSTKQNLLDASTNLLGIGTSISALNYNNITLNKPTNFQSDWTSTIINKPTNFQSDWSSTIINKPTNFQSDWNSTIINKPDLTVYAIKSTVDTSLNTINSTLATKQNTISVSTPLLKDVSNNITIDLSAYPLKTYVDGSLNTINSTLSTKQNTITAVTPLKKDVSNNISINLSGYTLLSSFNTLSTTVSTKENTLTFTTPLTRTTNTIGIDLSGYPLKTYVDGSLNTINSTLATKQNTITAVTPLKKDVSNNISIDLSGYTLLSSFNTLSTTVSTKENALTFTTPLTRATNTIGIDLSGYPLKTYVDGSLNTINSTLANKQNNLTFSTPLIKDVSNNVTIDLSAYPLKTYVDGSLNTINTNKQNNLTFSNPFLNTSNTISLKYNSAQFNIDASGNLSLVSTTSSQWTTSGTNIYYNTGNVGIGKTPAVTLDVSGNISSSGTISSSGNIDCGGGLALNGANAFYNTTSVDTGNYSNTYLTFRPSITNNDWCYVRQVGSDNTYKLAFDFHDDDNDARFCIRNVQSTNNPDTITEVFTVDNGNVSCTGKITLLGELVNGNWKMTNDSDYCRLYNSAGTSYFNFGAKTIYASDSLTVALNGSFGGTLYVGQATTIRAIVNDRGGYDHSQAPLTITNQTITGTTLNDSLPVLNLCRQGLGGVAYGARATMCLSRFENSNVWSRTRLDFKLASDTYNDIMSMTLRSDGNYIFYPNPQNINNTNGANLTMNLNVGCYTTGFATAPFISCTVADGWNGIDTITTITAQSGANSGYNNASRMILDGSYATNAGRGAYGSYIYWQSMGGSGWFTNMELYTVTGGVISTVLNVLGSVKSNSVTLTSSENVKSNIRDIYSPLELINSFTGKHYHNKLTGEKDFGLIAEDIEKLCPCLTSRYEDSGVDIGVKYMNLTAVLIEGIKELNNTVQSLQKRIEILENK